MSSHTKAKTILLTGITGNMGAFAALRFLEKGHKVYAIVRPKKGFDCMKRARRSLRQFCDAESVAEAQFDNLRIIEGDIGDRDSLPSMQAPEAIDETWHFASSLKYMPKETDEIFGVNVNGLANMIELHGRSRGEEFFYISTAYLGGKNLRLVPEAPIASDANISHNNYYERSKMQAESMVIKAIETGQLKGAIFRPSVVFGERAEGKLIHYVGPYQVARTWHCLSSAAGELGKPDRTVRVAVDLDHSLNLIPLDTATDAMIELSEIDRGNTTVFNIVNKKEIPLQNAFGAIVRCTGFETVLCSRDELRRSSRSIYESLISYSLDYISPYVNHKVAFETKEMENLLKREISVDVYPDLYTRSIGAYVASLRSASAN